MSRRVLTVALAAVAVLLVAGFLTGLTIRLVHGHRSTSPPVVAVSSPTPGVPPSPVPTAPASSSLRVSVPATIPAACSSDVTAALTAWIATVPDGATLVFHGGCYRIDHTLIVRGRHDLVFDGGGARFAAGTTTGDSSSLAHPDAAAADRAQWQVTDCSGITFEDMTVTGSNPYAHPGDRNYYPPLEHQHAFDIDGATGADRDITLRQVVARNTYGDAVYLRDVAGATLRSDTFSEIGRQGVSVISGSGVVLEDDTIGHVALSDVDLEPNNPGNTVTGVLIHDDTFGPSHLEFLAAAGNGIVDDVTVTDNTLVGHALTLVVYGSARLPRRNWTVSGNVSTTAWAAAAGSAPITITHVSGVRVTNNSQPLQAGRGDVGVDLAADEQAVVEGNSFPAGVAVVTGLGTGLVCGNRLSGGGSFDRPAPCLR